MRISLRRIGRAEVIGILFFLTAIAILPNGFLPKLFDRNAAPEFFFLSISATILGAIFVTRTTYPNYSIWFYIGALGLFASTIISLFLNKNIITGITGDVGRYTGLASLFGLMSIALFASLFTFSEFQRVINYLGLGILVVDLLGVLQQFKIIALPTGAGTGSTLGNLDFFSAWIGTTYLILILVIKRSRFRVALAIFITLFSFWLLALIGAKQGFIDFLVVLLGIGAYQLWKFLPRFDLSERVWTSIGTLFFLAWCEVIYLVPISKLPIPGIAGDSNVTVRSDFWFAGAAMFFHHFGFGVGPDNYGYFYEKFRSLSSVRNTESLISNDAHSAMVQSFATLGVVGVAFFVLLAVVLINSFVKLVRIEPANRKTYLACALFALVYLTNSLISPITLPNKFVFWTIAGFIIGSAAKYQYSFFAPWLLRVPVLASVILILGTSTLITTSAFKLGQAQDRALKNQPIKYHYSSILPCNMYFNIQADLAYKSGYSIEEITKQAISANPRCIDAVGSLATFYIDSKKYKQAKPYIYRLMDLVPARHQTLVLAAKYALAADDKFLISEIARQGEKMGISK